MTRKETIGQYPYASINIDEKILNKILEIQI
jgi:hypothetical protein